MWKEAEPGKKEINIERTEEALATLAGKAEALANLGGVETETSTPGAHDLQGSIIAVSCPFCMTMMSDGVKNKEQESKVQVFDLAELIASAEGINA
jgi:heterodisulfide reductase subunit D